MNYITKKAGDCYMKKGHGHLLAALLISTVVGCAESPDMQTQFTNATSLLQNGKIDRAIDAFRDLLAEYPQCYQASYNLALAYKKKGYTAETCKVLQELLSHNASYTKAYILLATVNEEEKKYDQAIVHYRQAQQLDPENISIYRAIGKNLALQGKYDAAIATYKQAVHVNDVEPSLLMDYANTLLMTNQIEEALVFYKRLLTLRPDDMNVLYNTAYTVKRLGLNEDAIPLYKKVLEVRPDYAHAHYGLGTAYLARAASDDDWLLGWEHYEWRWQQSSMHKRQFRQPMWDGSRLDGKKLYLWAEQGLGDTFQIMRYAEVAKEQYGAYVIVTVQRPLTQIMKLCPYIDEAIEWGKDPVNFDVQAPMMSLPHILKSTENMIPNKIPYLFADSNLIEFWARELSSDSNFRIGLCWQGNPNYSTHFLRAAVALKSMTPATLAPLAKISGASFYSLQKEHAENVDENLPEGFIIHAFGDDFDQKNGRFMDTAAVMKNLHLVITVDTSVAHLSGGLGVPTWTLLPKPADWRWMLDRTDTPWYPTMRLFRQMTYSDWTDVIEQLYDELVPLVQAFHERKS